MTERGREALQDSLEALSRMLLAATESLEDALRRVAALGCSLVGRGAEGSVLLLDRARPVTAGSTGDLPAVMDGVQVGAGDGPCLAAGREGRSIRVDSTRCDARWPEFCTRAVEHGVLGVLSVPLVLEDGTIGTLNLYSTVEGGFDDEEERLGLAFAARASVVTANCRAYWSTVELTRHLHVALESRGVIEQAKGILMAQDACTADQAFDILRRASQRENRKLRDLAQQIVTKRAADRRS